MKQLINITTVPIQYELKIQNARLQYKASTAEVEISRNKGGMRIKSRPVKLNIDSFEARNSVVPTRPAALLRQPSREKHRHMKLRHSWHRKAS